MTGAGLALALLLAVVVPLLAPDGYSLFLAEQAFVLIAAALSLNLLVGYCGLISLGHSALFALGAYTLAICETEAGWPFWLGLLTAAAVAAIAGVVIGFPALRLGRYTFAMITLGYALVSVKLPLAWPALTGGGEGIHGVHGPMLGGVPIPGKAYAIILGLFAVATWVVLRNLIRSPFGRAMIAGDDSAPAAASLGVSIRSFKLTAFVISSVIVAVAGALYVGVLRTVDQDTFGLDLSVQLLLMVMLGGAGTLSGPVYGALILLAIPLIIDRLGGAPGSVTLLIYSLIVIAVVTFAPHGVSGVASRLLRRARERGAPDVAEQLQVPSIAGAPSAFTPAGDVLLDVRELAYVIGGLRAIDGVSLQVRGGTVHGLIGPNGAGKTSLINCITGFVKPTGGSVAMRGKPLTPGDPAARPADGIVRTFQHPETFTRLTCIENVLVAIDRRTWSTTLASIVRAPSAARRERRDRAAALDVLRLVGLAPYAERPAGELAPGLRQILSLARAVAKTPAVLLLDEPAGGLNESELGVLEATLRSARERGAGVLLIDHNAEFVLRVCDTITVVDYGKVIADGEPADIRTDRNVIAAYLGEPLAEPLV
jgi:ABC-type branched-subunit amino acid transport system ATPase component/ABC-type branched-subunit amino acid transport system permease subunit